MLLRPLKFPEPARLVMVWERTPVARANGRTTNVGQTQNYLDWRARNRSFTEIAALQRLPMNFSGAFEAEQVVGLRVTRELFSILGVRPFSRTCVCTRRRRVTRAVDDDVDLPLLAGAVRKAVQARSASV